MRQLIDSFAPFFHKRLPRSPNFSLQCTYNKKQGMDISSTQLLYFSSFFSFFLSSFLFRPLLSFRLVEFLEGSNDLLLLRLVGRRSRIDGNKREDLPEREFRVRLCPFRNVIQGEIEGIHVIKGIWYPWHLTCCPQGCYMFDSSLQGINISLLSK